MEVYFHTSSHTEFIKVVRTEYSAFKSLSKMSQEQAGTVIITIIIRLIVNDIAPLTMLFLIILCFAIALSLIYKFPLSKDISFIQYKVLIGLVWLTSNHMFGSGNFWDKSPSRCLKILKLLLFYSGNFQNFKNALGRRKKSQGKRAKERKARKKPWFKRRKTLRFYKNLLAELRLEDEYNCKNYLRMTSENVSQ